MPAPDPPLPLAAIRFEDGQPVDALLRALATRLSNAGYRVGGVVQGRAQGGAGCAAMELHSLATGQVFAISQPLGPGSQGCRLDPGGLAECAQSLLQEVTGLDLLILNRFGKAEAEGRGLREVIAEALARGIPVLTALRGRHLDGWERFTGGRAVLLPAEPGAALRWVHGLAARGCAALA